MLVNDAEHLHSARVSLTSKKALLLIFAVLNTFHISDALSSAESELYRICRDNVGIVEDI